MPKEGCVGRVDDGTEEIRTTTRRQARVRRVTRNALAARAAHNAGQLPGRTCGGRLCAQALRAPSPQLLGRQHSTADRAIPAIPV